MNGEIRPIGPTGTTARQKTANNCGKLVKVLTLDSFLEESSYFLYTRPNIQR
jgi:hypothetical protein